MITLHVEKADSRKPVQKDIENWMQTVQAVIYARVSTQDQARHGYSLASQVERCLDLAKTRFDYADEQVLAVIEQGEMGDDPNRPALLQAIELLEMGIGRKLIVLHPDRLARDLRLQLTITEQIWNAGCEIAFVEMDVDPNNPESLLLYNIQGAIAQYNKAKILANSKRGRRTKVMNGKIPGLRRLYGYTFDKERDILVENEEEKQVYLQMVNWLLNGKNGQPMNFTLIARELSKLGVSAPNGNRWYQATVSRILKNDVYTGLFHYGKTEYQQKHGQKMIVQKPQSQWQHVEIPAFISCQTYEALQQRIQMLQGKERGRKPIRAYLVKGIVRCGRCGAAVVAGAPSRNRLTGEPQYYYYTCSAKSRKIFEVGTGQEICQCRGRNWRQDEVDQAVWQQVVEWVAEARITLNRILRDAVANGDLGRLNRKIETVRQALEHRLAERKRWIEVHVKGRVSEAELDVALREIDEHIQGLQEEEQGLEEAISLGRQEANVDRRETVIDNFLNYLKNEIPFEDRKKLVHLLVENVVLTNESIDIYPRFRDSSLTE